MNVTGTWTGEYAFDENPEAPRVAGQVVQFSMTLKQGFLGFVTGTIQDDPRSGFPEPGTVHGRLKGNTLGFKKIQPKMRLIHESSRLTLEDWADRQKVVIDTARAHPAALHMGKLSEDGQSMEGRWRIPAAEIDVPGSYQKLVIPALTGTWQLTRKA